MTNARPDGSHHLVRIVEHAPERLIVEDRSYRPSIALLSAAAFMGVVGVLQERYLAATVGPFFFTLMAWIAGFRAVTTFERGGVIRHVRRRVGRAYRQTHDTADLIEVGVVEPPLGNTRQHVHIQLTFADGSAYWLSPATGRPDRLKSIADTVREFVGMISPMSRDEKIRAMVRSGNRLGAVKMVRAQDGLSLDAAQRAVDTIAPLPEE